MKESALYPQWRQEHLAEGRAEGLKEARRSITLKMLAEGMSLDIIVKVTGYSINQT
jgi:hypothetical protein